LPESGIPRSLLVQRLVVSIFPNCLSPFLDPPFRNIRRIIFPIPASQWEDVPIFSS
jgi:hypothetical protein